MKLKKKVILGMVAGLFAVATVFNMSLLNNNGAGDVSMDAVSIMAQAQLAENPENDGYGALNTPCFDKDGNPTGKNRKSCFSGGQLESCTPHGCQ